MNTTCVKYIVSCFIALEYTSKHSILQRLYELGTRHRPHDLKETQSIWFERDTIEYIEQCEAARHS